MEQKKWQDLFEQTEETEAAQEAKTEKTDSVRKLDYRMIAAIVLSVFVLFVVCWGFFETVRMMREDTQQGEMASTTEQVEDNSENEGKSLDVDALIDRVLEEVAFDAELKKLDDSVASGMVETAAGTQLQIYMGNGTYADELLVMTAKSEADAKENQEYAAQHLQETEEAFEDYLPAEAEKIEQAVSIRCGTYVIVCVTSDSETAQTVIQSVIDGD